MQAALRLSEQRAGPPSIEKEDELGSNLGGL